MSKSQLRKELSLLTKEQLIDLTLDAYAARREVKDFYDFFLKPDAQALQDKYLKIIEREIFRSKYQRMKCRVSIVKKALKDFASFEPGAEWVVETKVKSLLILLQAVSSLYYTETIARFSAALLSDIIVTADRAAILNRFLPILITKIDSLRGADYIKHNLREILVNANQLANPLKQ